MNSQLSLLYTTFATQEDAVQIAQKLLDMCLIACANLSEGMRSLYLSEGRLEDTDETLALFKTTSDNVPKLMMALQDLHPYETPVMLEMPLHRANELFTKWVQDCVR
jgi:periplasmic divalent cation tolerance protein